MASYQHVPTVRCLCRYWAMPPNTVRQPMSFLYQGHRQTFLPAPAPSAQNAATVMVQRGQGVWVEDVTIV